MVRKGIRAKDPKGLRLVIDESHRVPQRLGGGRLRLQVWANAQGLVVRYNLAYINPLIFAGDNGRVLGYDDAHGYHHRHYFGRVEDVDFVSFESTMERFEREWRVIADEHCR